MKKKFLPSFQPPRLVKASQGWYVVWYEKNPATGQLQRFRNTFQLNRIPNKTQRAQRAAAIVEEITRALVAGGYAYAGRQESGLEYTPISEAMQVASSLKASTSVEATNQSYASHIRIFLAWARAERLEDLPVKAFTRLHAVRFLDSRKGVGTRTYNNYVTFMRSIWNALQERGYVESNPWNQVKKAKETAKNRRTFEPGEAAAVAAFIAGKNPGLFAAVLLQYYCFIRPNEMRQLRRRDFDLEGGVIRIPAPVAKSKRPRLVTMPENVRAYFLEQYSRTPPNYFLWGPNQKPHPAACQGKNEFYKTHKRLLQQLRKSGVVADITGLTFYSWKDTGLTEASKTVGLLDLMQQAGHHDPKITMVYIRQGKKNEAFQDLGPLLGEKGGKKKP